MASGDADLVDVVLSVGLRDGQAGLYSTVIVCWMDRQILSNLDRY